MARLTVKEVKNILKDIQTRSDDSSEASHRMEKNLWEDVLKAIAEDYREDAQDLAALALQTKDIEFSRWYA